MASTARERKGDVMGETSPALTPPREHTIREEPTTGLSEISFKNRDLYQKIKSPLDPEVIRDILTIACQTIPVDPTQLELGIKSIGKHANILARTLFAESNLTEKLEAVINAPQSGFKKFIGFFSSAYSIITSDKIPTWKDRGSRLVKLFKDPLEVKHTEALLESAKDESTKLQEGIAQKKAMIAQAVDAILAHQDGFLVGKAFQVTRDTPKIILQASIPATKYNSRTGKTTLFNFQKFVSELGKENDYNHSSPQLTFKSASGQLITFVDARPGRVAVYIDGKYQGSAWIDDALKHAQILRDSGEFKINRRPKNPSGQQRVFARAY